MSLCAIYAFPIEEKVREEYKADEKRKYDQQINHTNALAMTIELSNRILLWMHRSVERRNTPQKRHPVRDVKNCYMFLIPNRERVEEWFADSSSQG